MSECSPVITSNTPQNHKAGSIGRPLKNVEIAFEDGGAVSARYLQLLKGTVLRSAPEDISRIRGVGEGLENSIIREIKTAQTTEDLISALTSKRYTGATIRRALTTILVGLSWKEADFLTSRAPAAGRLLAAGEAGRRFMRERSGDGFTIVTNMNREEKGLAAAGFQMRPCRRRGFRAFPCRSRS